MSVSDPLLKNLKGFIYELRTKGVAVYDRNRILMRLCEVLEDIFRKGIKSQSWFGKGEIWNWIVKLPGLSQQRCNPTLSMVIDSVKDSKRVNTDVGKGRLFVRAALNKKVLGIPVQILAKERDLAAEWYEPDQSILGNEILNEILQSLLYELTEVQFHLKLRNASFLDSTWSLPLYKQYELVPCADLGLHVQNASGYLLVVKVEPGSVAEEDGKITAGDILDELYGEALRGVKLSYVHTLLQRYKGLPVHLNVVKMLDAERNIYKPILQLAREADINIDLILSKRDLDNLKETDTKKPPHALLPEEEEEEVPVQGSEGGAVYEAKYLGYANLGKDGRVERIEDSVATVLRNLKERIAVRIDLHEKDVLVYNLQENKVLFKHTYTEISACGRRTDALRYIGYIAGETTCSLASDFKCHVYEAMTDEEARLILCTLAQGFERTHLLL